MYKSKIKNKGFTLIELIIAISILTTIMFIGYNLLNKYTISSNEQTTISKGQSSMNNINKYLTKDLEQATDVIIYDLSEGETKYNNENRESTYLEDALRSIIENNSSEVKYKYEISTKNNDEKLDYIVHIKNNKYSISRVDWNNISIDFANNEKMNISKELQLPFKITGSNPYKVSTGYNKSNNGFVEYDFVITSRYIYANSNDNENTDGGSDTTEYSNNYLWYCLEMAKHAFVEAYESIPKDNKHPEKIQKGLIDIINPIIDISKSDPLTQNQYNDIISGLNLLNTNITKLLGNGSEGLPNGNPYKVVEVIKKGKHYLDVASKTIEVSPDSVLPDPPNHNIWNQYVNRLGEQVKSKINNTKGVVSNVKSALSNKDKYKLEYNSLMYMESNEYPLLDSYFQNQIYAIIKDKILGQNIKIDSDVKYTDYITNLYMAIDNINKFIESIIHVQFELDKIVETLDGDKRDERENLISCIDTLTEINYDLVSIKGYLEQATYKDENLSVYLDIFGQHSH